MTRRNLHHDLLMRENDDRLVSLQSSVANLKSVTLDIESAVRDHNTMLDDMGKDYSNAGELLKKTMNRLGVMLQSGGSRHMCYLMVFIIFVFLALWWFVKR
uniref:t-SNARE coiled-coil homology domain-containing protein n=1 Tax=Aureoumbra lagunensis TaxID=44058 RepID=A0A7S3K229_9STRA|mmetsp:Transcript_14457/g.19330  ORF Transcript_14457/g.19330 Transcript_14457/m.19330 type:complete len:101 (-) Transcript_14457:449-751(-)